MSKIIFSVCFGTFAGLISALHVSKGGRSTDTSSRWLVGGLASAGVDLNDVKLKRPPSVVCCRSCIS